MDLTVICQGCLSQDRMLKPIQELDNIFNIIFYQSLDTFKMVYTTTDILFCWECIQMLKSIERFHHKVICAQQTLQETVVQNNYGFFIDTLSSLASNQTNVIVSIDPDLQTSQNNITNSMETKLKCLNEVTISKVPKLEPRVILNKIPIDTLPVILKEKPFDADEKILDNLKKEDDSDDNFEYNYEPEDLKDIIKEEKNINLPLTKKKTITRTKIKPLKQTKNKVKKRIRKPQKKKVGFKTSTKIKFFKYYQNLLTVVPGSQHDIIMERAKSLNAKIKNDSQNSLVISSMPDDKNKELACTKCNEVCYNERDLTSHMRLHFQKYMCRFCADDVIYDEDHIIKHVNTEHKTEKMLCECNKCNKKFLCKEELDKHQEECGVLKCNDCDRVFGNHQGIVSHCRSSHMIFDCKECNTTYKTWSNYLQHKHRCHSNDDPGSAYCIKCDIQFKSKMSLHEHLRTSAKHIPESKVKTYHCTKCPNVYKKKLSLDNHYDKAHVGITKYHCEPCQKYFLCSSLLSTHHKRFHLKIARDRNYLCVECGKCFSDSVTLREHMTTHTGVKPYRCVHCGARYNKSGWYYHMTVAHPDCVRDVNRAKIHGAETIDDIEPEKVEPVKKFICNICGKAYKLKRYLAYHNNVHTGERPFTCKLCGKTFRFGGNYYKHLRKKHQIFGDKNKKKHKNNSVPAPAKDGSSEMCYT